MPGSTTPAVTQVSEGEDRMHGRVRRGREGDGRSAAVNWALNRSSSCSVGAAHMVDPPPHTTTCSPACAATVAGGVRYQLPGRMYLAAAWEGGGVAAPWQSGAAGAPWRQGAGAAAVAAAGPGPCLGLGAGEPAAAVAAAAAAGGWQSEPAATDSTDWSTPAGRMEAAREIGMRALCVLAGAA